MQAHRQNLGICTLDGVVYFSSDHHHLFAVTGCEKVAILKYDNETFKFNRDGSYEKCEDIKFVVKPKQYQGWKENYSKNYSNNKGTSSKWSHTPHDYDGDYEDAPWWDQNEDFRLEGSFRQVLEDDEKDWSGHLANVKKREEELKKNSVILRKDDSIPYYEVID